MIGVLLFSREAGRESSWAAVRGSREILVSGMSEGDVVEILVKGNGYNGFSFLAANKDSTFKVPEGAESIKAVHKAVGVSPDVCVDMR